MSTKYECGLDRTHCEKCGTELEVGQVGLCEACQAPDQDSVEEFDLYLKACTDTQVLGVLAKEIGAGRQSYALLAEQEARGRRLIVGSPTGIAHPSWNKDAQ